MTTNKNTRPSDPKEQPAWDEGYDYGFGGGRIAYERRFRYSPAFLLGFEAGKNEIDRMVEEVLEDQRRYGEWS